MKAARKNRKQTASPGELVSFYAGAGKVRGLGAVSLHQSLVNANGEEVGFVFGFDQELVEALFYSNEIDVAAPVYAGKGGVSVRTATSVVGRVLDGRGLPIDGLGATKGKPRSVFAPAPGILERQPITQPLTTGVKVVDATLPLGRGQRELIIGDRKLGKSTLALDIVLNQKHAQPAVICIMVLCGQKEDKMRRIVAALSARHAFLYTIVVAATAERSFAEQYLAPFVGCALGEHFRDLGHDVLVVYDDLSKHAKVYRDVSLLFERPPGRETYPGDIFSLHAGLLERAAKLSKKRGGGSLTALPIVETQEGDITAFIPTNLISITDGQIYFERGLFQKQRLPAINVGLSVSRIGSQAQPKPLQNVTGGIRLTLSQIKELQKLAQLETAVSQETRKRIHRGELTMALLEQGKHVFVSWPEQTVLFFLVEEGYFDDIDSRHWQEFEQAFLALMRYHQAKLLTQVAKSGLTDKVKKQVRALAQEAKEEFVNAA